MRKRSLTFCITATALLLAGCESEFVEDSTRPRPTRALASPSDRVKSGSSEVLGNPQGVVPLVSVDFANNKDEKPVVRTVLEPLSEIATGQVKINEPVVGAGGGGGVRPVTRPGTTRPATRPAPTAAEVTTLKVAQSRKPEDRFALSTHTDGNLLLTVTSPSGIGSVVLERTGESWPPIIHVHLRYSDQKAFSSVEGFTAGEIIEGARGVELKTTITKSEGRADVRIPGFSRTPRIAIDWIDAYR